MKTLNERIRDYAELIVREGANIQKGQRVGLLCPVECADFARMCVDIAFDAGAKDVIMFWYDDAISRSRYLKAPDEIFDSVYQWDIDARNSIAAEGDAWITIASRDPENLKGVDPDRLKRSQIASGKAMDFFRDKMGRNDMPWCVCSVPSLNWAKKVFPDASDEEAMERLWEEILTACRVDGGDAISNWRTHTNELRDRVDKLNSLDLKYLRYKNSAGTDLTLELPEGHFWAGGDEMATAGHSFSANIPTEEVFTLPKRDAVNGTIVATKPLSHNGNLIEDFSFTLKDGKIVEVKAEKGEEVLKDAISVDEGASYLGEVALVPFDSPISNSGVLFYNTLFDENASCHFAFGDAYPMIKGAEEMDDKALLEHGANVSITHVDFMVGSRDLSIVGTTKDGKEIAIFENGNFAI